MKKIIAIILSVVLLLSIIPIVTIPATAAGQYTGNRDWKWPVPAVNAISSCYGDGRNHWAIDIYQGGKGGASVYASYPGRVIKTYTDCAENYPKDTDLPCPCGKCGDLGNSVYILHTYMGTNFVSRYGHLKSVSVKTGDEVNKNTVIGILGSTGQSGGYHLDFKIIHGTQDAWSRDQTVDPLKDQFLDIPAGLNASGATSSCCYSYINDVINLYTQSSTIPGKPALCDFDRSYVSGQMIYFYWNPTQNTTHYNLYIDKMNSSGEWERCNTYHYAQNGYSTSFSDGIYRALIQSTNADAAGWPYTDGDWVIFTIGEHAHDKGTYVFYEKSHPHCNCYRCSYCGEIWRDYSSSNYVDGCLECHRPEKPIITGLRSEYTDSDTIQFNWTSDSNTTHTNFWLEKKNGNEWSFLEKVDYATSGITRKLNVGDYRVHVVATNSNYWEEDGSSWLYNQSEYYYFTVTPSVPIVPISITPGVYTIHSARKNDKVLDIAGDSKENGANIQLYDFLDNEVQQFEVIQAGEYYYIKSVYSGNWLDVHQPLTGSGANVQLYNTNIYAEEKWQFENAGDGYVYIRNYYGNYLDISGDSAVNNANIQVYHSKESDSQRWRLIPKTFKININANGGTASTKTLQVNYQAMCNLSPSYVSRDGYKLKGWNLYRPADGKWFVRSVGWCTDSEISSQSYSKQTYSSNLSMSLDVTWLNKANSPLIDTFTFYAVWEKIPDITVTFNANGGVCSTTNKTVTTGSTYGTLPTPTRMNYTFDGWYTAASGGTKVTSSTKVTATENHTLYAHWTHVCANGHNYSYNVTTAPTTSATGILTGTCSLCSATTTVTLPKLNTTDYTYAVTKAATCTATGTGRYTWKTTTYGSFYFDVTIAKTAHNYKDTVTAPTCTEKGYTTHTCSVCGDSYKDTYTDALGHDWDDGVVTTKPTETTEGVKTFTCVRCGATRTEAVLVLDHTHAYTPTVTAPTCTEKGYTTYICACGDSYKGNYIAALGHNYTYKVATTPTTSASGVLTGTCSRCSATTMVTLPKLNTTDYTYAVTKAATCTATGTGRYTWKTTTYGSFYFDVTIAKTAHSYKTTVTAPTCTAQGYTTHMCSVCGDSYVTDYVGALGHNFVGGVCTRCGEDDPNYNPPTPTDPCEGYTDIDRSKWYHDAADFVIARGLMGSTKTNALTFEPNTPCTRSMIVMILYNIAGTPDVSYVAKFPDVKDGQWYTKAVMWAYQNGIVSGYDNGKFGPNDKVTREQMAVVLKGYADFIGKDTSKTADLSKFPDGNKATWSKSYISWAVAEGLINGKAQNGQTYLDPQGVATRAEVAALIRSFVLNILEAK